MYTTTNEKITVHLPADEITGTHLPDHIGLSDKLFCLTGNADKSELMHTIREIIGCCDSVEVKKIAVKLFSFMHDSSDQGSVYTLSDLELLKEEESLLNSLLISYPGDRNYMKQLAECFIRSGEILYKAGWVSDGLKYFGKALNRVNTLEDRINSKEFLQMRIRLYRSLIEIYSLVSGIHGLSSHLSDSFPPNLLQIKINALQANYYQDLAKMSYKL